MNEINQPNYSPPPDFPATPIAPSPLQSAPPRQKVLSKIARTVKEGVLLMLLANATAVVLTLAHAKFFLQSGVQTQGVNQMLRGNLIVFFALAVIVFPVMEEAIFRGLPNLVMRLSTRPETRLRFVLWLLFGLASSLLFAALHGMRQIGVPPHARFAFQTLPVPQLLMGLWAWRVATLRGLRYSMLLHATFNFSSLILSFVALALGQKI